MMENEQLLLRHDTTVTCPGCAEEFSLERGFAKKALEQLAGVSAQALGAFRDAERSTVEARAAQLAEAQARTAQTQIEAVRQALADRDVQLNAFRQREAALTTKESQLEARSRELAKIKAAELIGLERASFERQLDEKANQLATLRAEQVTLLEERGKIRDERAALALEVQRRVQSQLESQAAQIRAEVHAHAQLEKAELQKKLDDVGQQLETAKRRAEQGSQQLQGEVLELAIEENLRRAFPLDTIEEVRKGQRGGDVLQHVVTRTGQIAGTILWETKRAKDWNVQWISKLKEDMRECRAAVGILVTVPGVLPKEWPGKAYFALHEDIWVTQTTCAVSVAEVLRVGIMDVHRQRAVSAGKGEKMEALYDYLTSPQFAFKLKAVYDTFKKLKDELESEKSTTMQRWARREKQLQSGQAQLLSIGGEVQGLAQHDMPLLELETDAGEFE